MGGECKLHSSPHAYEQFAQTLLFHERHQLTVVPGGYHISNKEQREYSIAFLQRVQDTMGFQTHPTITLLRNQWHDLD